MGLERTIICKLEMYEAEYGFLVCVPMKDVPNLIKREII